MTCASNSWIVATLVLMVYILGDYLAQSIKCYSCFSQYEQGRVSGIPCLKPAENDVKIIECENDIFCMNFMVIQGPNATLARGCSHGWCSHSKDWSGPHIDCCQSSLCNTNIPNVEPEQLVPTPEPTESAQKDLLNAIMGRPQSTNVDSEGEVRPAIGADNEEKTP